MPKDEIPNEFKSFEELDDFLNSKVGNKLTKKSTSAKVTPARPQKQDADVSILSAQGLELPLEQIYQVLHIYSRPGVNWQVLLKEAKDEASFKNNNVRVIAHDHSYGDSCGGKDGKCRVIIGDSGETEVS